MSDTTPDYDNPVWMKTQLHDLGRLRALVDARREAGYIRKERISSWIVLGQLLLDACGNTGRIGRNGPTEPSMVPDVMHSGDLCRFTQPNVYLDVEMGDFVPRPGERCARCGREWSIRDWLTFQRGRDGAARHARCALLERADDARDKLESALRDSGLCPAKISSIQNEYCPCDFCPPWFLVDAGFGPLRIGRRKRVFNLDWSACRLDRQPDFSQEDVTKGEGYIHAWTPEHLRRYLVTIKGCASGGAAE